VFFRVEDPALDEVLPWLAEAFTAAWQHTVDRDDFASLVLQAHLDARQVQLVRAACQYLRQAGLGASRSYVRGILSGHREFVQHWVEVFEQRFNPDGPSSADSRLAKYADAATTRDEFRVLDWYAGLLEAITRTNYFRRGSDGRPPLTTVFKLDPARLPFATDPAVKVETFVHHPATPASMRTALSAVASRVCAMRIFQPSSVFSLPPGFSFPVDPSVHLAVRPRGCFGGTRARARLPTVKGPGGIPGGACGCAATESGGFGIKGIGREAPRMDGGGTPGRAARAASGRSLRGRSC
jgi:hypothetical protein